MGDYNGVPAFQVVYRRVDGDKGAPAAGAGLAVAPEPPRAYAPIASRKQRYEVPTRKGKWTPSEDAELVVLVGTYGRMRWREIANRIPGRTGKQARERWINQLAPEVKGGKWTGEEDRRVLLLRGQLGNKWSRIASSLPGRTDNQIKNRFYSKLRQRLYAGFYDDWLMSEGWCRQKLMSKQSITPVVPPPLPQPQFGVENQDHPNQYYYINEHDHSRSTQPQDELKWSPPSAATTLHCSMPPISYKTEMAFPSHQPLMQLHPSPESVPPFRKPLLQRQTLSFPVISPHVHLRAPAPSMTSTRCVSPTPVQPQQQELSAGDQRGRISIESLLCKPQ